VKLNEEHPFSKGTINRIGEGIRGRRELNEDDYLQVMAWFDKLNETVITIALEEVEEFSQSEDFHGETYRIKPPIESSHRVKTDDTIADKLDGLGQNPTRARVLFATLFILWIVCQKFLTSCRPGLRPKVQR